MYPEGKQLTEWRKHIILPYTSRILSRVIIPTGEPGMYFGKWSSPALFINF